MCRALPTPCMPYGLAATPSCRHQFCVTVLHRWDQALPAPRREIAVRRSRRHGAGCRREHSCCRLLKQPVNAWGLLCFCVYEFCLIAAELATQTAQAAGVSPGVVHSCHVGGAWRAPMLASVHPPISRAGCRSSTPQAPTLASLARLEPVSVPACVARALQFDWWFEKRQRRGRSAMSLPLLAASPVGEQHFPETCSRSPI